MHLMVLVFPDCGWIRTSNRPITSLDAPDGAGCSLTSSTWAPDPDPDGGLNAPDGAGCPLTVHVEQPGDQRAGDVLMHLMVLGAP